MMIISIMAIKTNGKYFSQVKEKYLYTVRGALSKKVLVQPDLGQCTSGEKSVR
jgi:hypothetical protein